MAWVIVEDGAVVIEFNRPTAFTYKDLQYPRNWIQNATAEEKSAIGLVEVTISGSQKNSNYYTNNLGNLVIAGDGSVSRTLTNTAIAINNASDIDELKACYETTAGASQTAKEIDATSSSVVSTSDNTITSNGHGFVDDEQVQYDAGMTDSDTNTAIGGLVSRRIYYVFGKTTNTFKLSESHSSCGDAAAVSLSSGATGTNHTFASLGIPGKGVVWPIQEMSKYDGA